MTFDVGDGDGDDDDDVGDDDNGGEGQTCDLWHQDPSIL